MYNADVNIFTVEGVCVCVCVCVCARARARVCMCVVFDWLFGGGGGGRYFCFSRSHLSVLSALRFRLSKFNGSMKPVCFDKDLKEECVLYKPLELCIDNNGSNSTEQ